MDSTGYYAPSNDVSCAGPSSLLVLLAWKGQPIGVLRVWNLSSKGVAPA